MKKVFEFMQRLCFGIAFGMVADRAASRRKRDEQSKELLRHFKIEISYTALGKKVRLVQRDTPLNDDELQILIDSKVDLP